MKIVVWFAAVLILAAISVQLYNLYTGNGTLLSDLEKARGKAALLKEENTRLKADVEYFSEPENLAKELKARFDYKKPGEKLIKIQ